MVLRLNYFNFVHEIQISYLKVIYTYNSQTINILRRERTFSNRKRWGLTDLIRDIVTRFQKTIEGKWTRRRKGGAIWYYDNQKGPQYDFRGTARNCTGSGIFGRVSTTGSLSWWNTRLLQLQQKPATLTLFDRFFKPDFFLFALFILVCFHLMSLLVLITSVLINLLYATVFDDRSVIVNDNV